MARNYTREGELQKSRRALAAEWERDDLEGDLQRRRNELEIIAVACGLSLATVVDLFNSGWRFVERTGQPSIWVKNL